MLFLRVLFFISALCISNNALATKEMVFFAQDAKVSANEKSSTVVVLGGNLEFAGECEELVVFGGNVKILSSARVNKSLVLLAGNIQQDPGAKIAGERIVFQVPEDFPQTLAKIGPFLGLVFGGIHWLTAALGWFFLQFIAAFVLQKSFPNFWTAMQGRMENEKGRNILGFIFYLVLFFPFLLSLVISLVGILLIPFLVFYYFLVYLLGAGVSAAWLGRKIPNLKERPILALLAGLMIFLLLKASWYGSPIALSLQFLGCGAFFLQTYRAIFKRSA